MITNARNKLPCVTICATALLTGLALAAPAQAGGVTAGTLIENTAIASYDEGGVPRSVNSNTVTVRVDELLDVTLT